jgi:hypothetical protein
MMKNYARHLIFLDLHTYKAHAYGFLLSLPIAFLFFIVWWSIYFNCVPSQNVLEQRWLSVLVSSNCQNWRYVLLLIHQCLCQKKKTLFVHRSRVVAVLLLGLSICVYYVSSVNCHHTKGYDQGLGIHFLKIFSLHRKDWISRNLDRNFEHWLQSQVVTWQLNSCLEVHNKLIYLSSVYWLHYHPGVLKPQPK